MTPSIFQQNEQTTTEQVTTIEEISSSDTSDISNNTTVNDTTTMLEIDYDGYVTIVVIDKNDTVVINDEIGYVDGDTLFTLLDDNYTLGCADSSYNLTDVCEPVMFGSRLLLQIDTVITNWTSSYLAIYINDIYATKGVDSIPLEDGSVYKFVYMGT